MTIQEIEHAIEELSSEEMEQLHAWLDELEMELVNHRAQQAAMIGEEEKHTPLVIVDYDDVL